ncbi:hypothetical protein L596_023395 [Steinernema carpocapsae]|uniref:Uncharacterized protein n=1 Tax=Steinernema carpocapsae TaxID=34508 RepID=A0A4U5MDI5_STECR|nr:hypothetical protein L596_023395 [Steinernema carpocapsae]
MAAAEGQRERKASLVCLREERVATRTKHGHSSTFRGGRARGKGAREEDCFRNPIHAILQIKLQIRGDSRVLFLESILPRSSVINFVSGRRRRLPPRYWRRGASAVVFGRIPAAPFRLPESIP